MSKIVKTAETKMNLPRLRELYNRQEKIAMVTAYDYTMARMVDEAGADIILVGDSLGMVIMGESSTLPVNIEQMEYHTRCVAKGVRRAHIMADMNFMSYQVSHEEAVFNAGKLIKAGAESIKLEGGEEMGDLVWYLNKIGIPVMAHIGLKPQSINTMGGYKVQGKSKADAEMILSDAKNLEEAGAFGLLLEGVPLEVAREITENVAIPTIGIGSGPFCSGQVLVCYDILGANPDFSPRFVRPYANLHDTVTKAVSQYVDDVKTNAFPSEKESIHRNLVEVKTGGKGVKKD